MNEILSVAPMMEWTNPHFRYVLRMISKRTVLYTEMAVDNTVIHAPDGFLPDRIGLVDPSGASVIQLGGSDPSSLAHAAGVLNSYGVLTGHYQELNLNCGCPSNKVTKRGCFGAKLMLQPGLVRQIIYSMARVSSCPVTVKCRLGVANHRDKYDDLVEFISEAHAGGANKFIIHCRDCVLEGLSPKQNREVPPLRYNELQKLRHDFPDLTFILNGGVKSLEEARGHMHPGSTGSSELADDSQLEETFAPHGVMIGRAVIQDPLLLATADTRIFGCKQDPSITRREILDDYGKYCDSMFESMENSFSEGKVLHRSKKAVLNAYLRTLLGGVANLFTGIRRNRDYVKHVHPTDHDIRNFFDVDTKLGEMVLPHDATNSIAQYLDKATLLFNDEVLDEKIGKT